MLRRGKGVNLDDRTRMLHMLEAARQASSFITGRARADLESDHMLRRALKDCVQEIGEAAARVTDAGRQAAPTLPWEKIVGMRHILVHAYYDLDADAIWKVVAIDVPVLIGVPESALGPDAGST